MFYTHIYIYIYIINNIRSLSWCVFAMFTHACACPCLLMLTMACQCTHLHVCSRRFPQLLLFTNLSAHSCCRTRKLQSPIAAEAAQLC